MFGIRRSYSANGLAAPHWFWHPWAYGLRHSGWFFFSLAHPVWTLSWWWRFAVGLKLRQIRNRREYRSA